MSECRRLNEVQLRREARRRKILENSESRLRSITGREDSSFEIDNHISDAYFGAGPYEFTYENKSDNLTEEFDHIPPSKNELLQENRTVLGASYDNIFDGKTESKGQVQVKKTFLNSIIEKRFHYAILSVLVHFLLICKLGFFFYDNLFCPFIIVKLMEFMLVQEHVRIKQTNFLNLVTSIIKGSTVAYICKILSIIGTAISDFLLYIFFLILSDKLFSAVIDAPLPITILSNKEI